MILRAFLCQTILMFLQICLAQYNHYGYRVPNFINKIENIALQPIKSQNNLGIYYSHENFRHHEDSRSCHSESREECVCFCEECYNPKACCSEVCNKCKTDRYTPSNVHSSPYYTLPQPNVMVIPYPLPVLIFTLKTVKPDKNIDITTGTTKANTGKTNKVVEHTKENRNATMENNIINDETPPNEIDEPNAEIKSTEAIEEPTETIEETNEIDEPNVVIKPTEEIEEPNEIDESNVEIKPTEEIVESDEIDEPNLQITSTAEIEELNTLDESFTSTPTITESVKGTSPDTINELKSRTTRKLGPDLEQITKGMKKTTPKSKRKPSLINTLETTHKPGIKPITKIIEKTTKTTTIRNPREEAELLTPSSIEDDNITSAYYDYPDEVIKQTINSTNCKAAGNCYSRNWNRNGEPIKLYIETNSSLLPLVHLRPTLEKPIKRRSIAHTPKHQTKQTRIVKTPKYKLRSLNDKFAKKLMKELRNKKVLVLQSTEKLDY